MTIVRRVGRLFLWLLLLVLALLLAFRLAAWAREDGAPVPPTTSLVATPLGKVAVTATGLPDQHDPRHAATAALLGLPAWATDPQPGLTVTLTDLGRYLVRRRLLRENAHAPLTDQTS